MNTNTTIEPNKESTMNMAKFAWATALLMTVAFATSAQSSSPATPHLQPHAAPTNAISVPEVPAAAQPAVAVVVAFGKALAGSDFKQVEALLDSSVIILESGGAERSRAEYLGHHARSDAAFLGGAQIAVLQRTAYADGALAWVASESEIRASKDGKPLILRSTETMVLRRDPTGWRIVHIHWSSRPHKGNRETP